MTRKNEIGHLAKWVLERIAEGLHSNQRVFSQVQVDLLTGNLQSASEKAKQLGDDNSIYVRAIDLMIVGRHKEAEELLIKKGKD